jgi:alkaline phosphatase D
VALPSAAHAVHVEVTGLRPGAEHFYRFRADGDVSAVGRTVTAPLPGVLGRPLAMGLVSCANWGAGYFTAYRALAEDHPDLVLHLGDYIYESHNPDSARTHAPDGVAVTLADYRVRHAQTHSDPDLQAAHAAAPWSPVWDDHDVQNNYAGLVPRRPEPGFGTRRAAAYRAYYEHLPLRRGAHARGPFRQMYRRVAWGDLATFHMLDTRQYRDDQPCGDGVKDCAEAGASRRTILGGTQEKWLFDGLSDSRATWDLLGQQVFFGARDMVAGPRVGYQMDAWDGYTADRQRVLDAFTRLRVANPVILTGDVHKNYANDIAAGPDPTGPPIATELVTTSITSDGDGVDLPPLLEHQLTENPQIKLLNDQRGYVRTRIERDQLTADFRVVPYVTRRGAPVSTRASFAIQAGNPGLVPL